ncbi:endonuclease/exonuclease/phosphatase family protein [Streptomyces sp. NPDC014734]|uniref:endonuclease/exonuclease/phosphatase family protein n=1 Tax=Streptomyces sp. NPDC014734 TaxID=3364886 RepID=UPI0036F55968
MDARAIRGAGPDGARRRSGPRSGTAHGTDPRAAPDRSGAPTGAARPAPPPAPGRRETDAGTTANPTRKADTTGHGDGARGGTATRRGRRTAAVAAATATVMLVAAVSPSGPGNLFGLLQTFLPWLGLGVPALLALAAIRRAPLAAVAVLLPAAAWCLLFGGLLTDKHADDGDVTVVSHNVHDGNPDPRGTAHDLAASGAGLLALQELTSRTTPAYEKALAGDYPYHVVRGTVGVWSTYPLRDPEPVEIMPWTRALRVTADTPKGPLAVYVAHLASVRVSLGGGFATQRRDEAAAKLAEAVRAEPLPRVVVAGDLNGTPDDTSLRPLTGHLRSAQRTAGQGFGFTWPAAFPVARIDQILVRGVTPTASSTLPRTSSDHLPVTASLRL